MVAAQFLPIGTETMNVQDVKATGEDTSDNVVLSMLDKYGYTTASYTWCDWAADDPCWINDDFEPVEDVTIGPGSGLWIQASSESQSVQTAGKVGLEDVVVALRQGNTAVGNPFPIDLDLQDILATGDDTSDNVVASTLDKFGYTIVSYTWCDWAADDPCWINDDFEPVSDVTVQAGAGLWVQASSDNQGVRFPAPKL